MAGEAKQGTIIPSHGVDPYHFSKVNVGTAVGNLAKKAAGTAVQVNKLKETRAAEAAAGEKAKKISSTISNLETISNLSKGDYPSTGLDKSPRARAQKGVLSRQMKPRATAKGVKKPAPMGTTTPVFQEPGAPAANTAVKAVAASRKRARQVKPATETSLTIKRL